MLLAYQIANCVPVGPGLERDVSTHPAYIWSVTTKSVSGPYHSQRYRWNLRSSPSLLVESIPSGAVSFEPEAVHILLRLKRTKSSTSSHACSLALFYTAPIQLPLSPRLWSFQYTAPPHQQTILSSDLNRPASGLLGKLFVTSDTPGVKVVTTTSIPPQHRSELHSSSMSGWICMTTVGFACGGENSASYRQGTADS